MASREQNIVDGMKRFLIQNAAIHQELQQLSDALELSRATTGRYDDTLWDTWDFAIERIVKQHLASWLEHGATISVYEASRLLDAALAELAEEVS